MDAEEPVAVQADAPITLDVDDVEVTFELLHDRAQQTVRGSLANSFSRRPRRRIHAVRGVTLQAQEGEAVGLIGRNGSGKSTLLRAMAGLVPVQRGSVHARSQPVLLGIGAALQPHLSGRRNVFLGATALGLTGAEVTERMDEILEFAAVGEFIDAPLRTYSAGMAARLRFAIASAVTPDILLVDEILGVGDSEFRRRSDARMRELLAAAGTVVLVSHNLRSIADLCTRAVWLHEGRILLEGPTMEVIAAYDHDAEFGRGTPDC